MEQMAAVNTAVAGLKKEMESQCCMKFELEIARSSLKVTFNSPQLLSYIMADNGIHDLKHLTIGLGRKKKRFLRAAGYSGTLL